MMDVYYHAYIFITRLIAIRKTNTCRYFLVLSFILSVVLPPAVFTYPIKKSKDGIGKATGLLVACFHGSLFLLLLPGLPFLVLLKSLAIQAVLFLRLPSFLDYYGV